MNARQRAPKPDKTRRDDYPKKFPYVSANRVKFITVYRRKTPGGNDAFMVTNPGEGGRRFECYAVAGDADQAAEKLAKGLSKTDTLAGSVTRAQAVDYASVMQMLQPLNVALLPAVTTVVEAVKIVGDLPSVIEGAKLLARRQKRTTAKPVADVVAELLTIKEGRGASDRYMQDLRWRLTRFGEACQMDACNVTTADIQAWLDKQKLNSQNYTNFRRVLYTLFKFAVARGYASDNPVDDVERVKVRNGDVEIFTPVEIARLLAAATALRDLKPRAQRGPDFVPSLAIGAFAGLRSAEIERLEWSDVDLAARHIVVGASRAKTASRRIVPIHDNLAAWLAPYAERTGPVWTGNHDEFYDAQQAAAKATAVKADAEHGVRAQKAVEWKVNALRHSYASYRFAQIGDAGRVAGELGNSAAVVHRHYRELVKPADAVKWFAVKPDAPVNVVPMAAAGQP
jgi:integrase